MVRRIHRAIGPDVSSFIGFRLVDAFVACGGLSTINNCGSLGVAKLSCVSNMHAVFVKMVDFGMW